MRNPFSLDFGAVPNLYIRRTEESNRIISTFQEENPSSHMYIIMGARGTGKTVLMTSIAHTLRDEDKWIHIDLNGEVDILNTMAAKLQESVKNRPKLKADIKVKGMGVSLEQDAGYKDVQVDLDKMLCVLGKKGMRILVTIDEVVNSDNVRVFTTYFQHCLREEYPVFLVMTGLFKNVRALQNNRSQTFLRRSPKIVLTALSNRRIINAYMEAFNVSEDEASQMANCTKGYSYAFQILGYLISESGGTSLTQSIINEYRAILEEASYEKIWEELSPGERQVLIAATKLDAPTNKDVREILGIDANTISTYKDTLEKSGIISSSSGYGHIDFELPFFKEFVVANS